MYYAHCTLQTHPACGHLKTLLWLPALHTQAVAEEGGQGEGDVAMVRVVVVVIIISMIQGWDDSTSGDTYTYTRRSISNCSWLWTIKGVREEIF